MGTCDDNLEDTVLLCLASVDPRPLIALFGGGYIFSARAFCSVFVLFLSRLLSLYEGRGVEGLKTRMVIYTTLNNTPFPFIIADQYTRYCFWIKSTFSCNVMSSNYYSLESTRTYGSSG